MSDTAPIVITGAGGHGRVVWDTCRAAGLDVAGFTDSEQPKGAVINGLPVLGGNALLDDGAFVRQHRFLIAIGNQEARRKLSLQVLEQGGSLATAIHPSCIVSDTAEIGAGSVLVAGSIVNANARIGRYAIVNTAATIDHDCRLDDGVQVCPGAHLAGNVHCGAQVFIGTGAVLVPGVSIGEGSIIGAGAVVLESQPERVLAAGNPARVIRSL